MGVAPRMPGSGIKFAYKELVAVVLTLGVVRASIITENSVITPSSTESTEYFRLTTTGSGTYNVRANKDGYYAVVASQQLIKDAPKVFYSAGNVISSGGPSSGTVYKYIVAF